MAPGSWSAAGNVYALALASEAARCGRSLTIRAGHHRAGALLPAFSSGKRE